MTRPTVADAMNHRLGARNASRTHLKQGTTAVELMTAPAVPTTPHTVRDDLECEHGEARQVARHLSELIHQKGVRQ